MTAEQKKQLQQKLWDIANELRGKMAADQFRDYILGLIFYKYLSERMHAHANRILGEKYPSFTKITYPKPFGMITPNSPIKKREEGKCKLKPLAKFLFKSLGIFQFPNRLTCMRRLVRKVYVGLRFVVGLSRHRQCRKDTIGLAFAQAVAFSCS